MFSTFGSACVNIISAQGQLTSSQLREFVKSDLKHYKRHRQAREV